MSSAATSSRCSAARRRVAARGARAAGRASAAHRRALVRNRARSSITGPSRGVPAGVGATGLDRRPQCRRSSTAGPPAIPTAFADMRRTWSRSRRTSSWLIGSCGRGAVAAGDTATVPIVFAIVPDPVGAGFVDSLARPGGNVTGFMLFEYGMSGKWLELLKEIAPQRDASGGSSRSRHRLPGSASSPQSKQWRRLLGMELSPSTCATRPRSSAPSPTFARATNGGLIVTASPSAMRHRDPIVTLAARHRLPAVYSFRYYVAAGGLISYGPDPIDQYRRAAGLRRPHPQRREAGRPAGASSRPSSSWSSTSRPPRRSASTVPPSLLARADEVIE